jgi:DNA repair exonuclease SbcCD nuclease subunit
MPEEVVVAHTSDLHIGGWTRRGDQLASLRAVLDASTKVGAAAVVLAGDIFDTHRVAEHVLDGAAELLASVDADVVLLPGNHDPAVPDAVYRRHPLSGIPKVRVFGVTDDDTVRLDGVDLELDGLPHREYADMSPVLPSPDGRSMRWRIAVAHGHWVRGPDDEHRAWLIHDHEIAACDADYLALGHWDLAQAAGDGSVPAYYSGSPDIAKTLNVVRFSATGVEVRRHPLDGDALP